jgi:hypothetical protein
VDILDINIMDDSHRIFEIDSQHHILICRCCQYAVVPSHAKTHLNTHHKRLSIQQRADFVSRVERSTELAKIHTDASRGNEQTMKQLQHANDDELLDAMSHGEGKSLVDIAVENGKVVVLKYLRKEGYDILRPSAGHMHPLMLSIYCGQVSTMQYLVAEGAMLDTESFIRPMTISYR